MTSPYRRSEGNEPRQSPREKLHSSIEFALRVANHADHLEEKETEALADGIVEAFDEYLRSVDYLGSLRVP
jgi:hypothetical protein